MDSPILATLLGVKGVSYVCGMYIIRYTGIPEARDSAVMSNPGIMIAACIINQLEIKI